MVLYKDTSFVLAFTFKKKPTPRKFYPLFDSNFLDIGWCIPAKFGILGNFTEKRKKMQTQKISQTLPEFIIRILTSFPTSHIRRWHCKLMGTGGEWTSDLLRRSLKLYALSHGSIISICGRTYDLVACLASMRMKIGHQHRLMLANFQAFVVGF